MKKNRNSSFKNTVILPNVKLGKSCQFEDFCIIGKSEANKNGKLVIGHRALIRSHTVIYLNNFIGDDFKTGNGAVIRGNNHIGNRVVIGNHTVIEGDCVIEDDVTIHSSCYIGEDTMIKKGAWIGPGCTTLLTPHPRCRHKHLCNRGPLIEKNAIIGGGTILMPRITIGEGAIIGSGSIVTKDVHAGMVATGIPAIITKKVEAIVCPFGKKYERILD